MTKRLSPADLRPLRIPQERDTARESCGTQPTELVVSSKKGAARPLGESGSPRSREGVSEGEAERAVVKPAVKPSPLPLPRPMASGSGASGAFAAAQFSFLSAGQEDEEGREEGDASRDEISSVRNFAGRGDVGLVVAIIPRLLDGARGNNPLVCGRSCALFFVAVALPVQNPPDPLQPALTGFQT